MTPTPRILSVREQDAVITRVLERRLRDILPTAMREAEIDMWLIICQEDDLDPVYRTMIPLNTWTPILQILIFADREGDAGVERINLSMTRTESLFDQPYDGRHVEEQWKLLARIVAERDPRRIGINIGRVQWAAGGLTHNLYSQLVAALPKRYVERLVSAEPAVIRWLATLTDLEIDLFDHVVAVSRSIIAECYSRRVVTVGVTTTTDLEWHYRQRCVDLGVEVSFKPSFGLVRSTAAKARYGADDPIIRPGDLIHCDVGLRHLRLTSDHQQWAYVLRPGEEDAPKAFRRLMEKAHELQDVFMGEFRAGLTGNELLHAILNKARAVGLPNPRVYSHSLGLYLHEPGPLIGLPWEQETCPGRGDVSLKDDYAFTMELSVADGIPEWNGEALSLAVEEDVVFTGGECRLIGGRRMSFYLI